MAQVERRAEPDQSMNSRVSLSVEGIDPTVRDRAEAAARRAGMSLSDWLNSTIGEPLPPSFSAPSAQRPAMPSHANSGQGLRATVAAVDHSGSRNARSRLCDQAAPNG